MPRNWLEDARHTAYWGFFTSKTDANNSVMEGRRYQQLQDGSASQVALLGCRRCKVEVKDEDGTLRQVNLGFYNHKQCLGHNFTAHSSSQLFKCKSNRDIEKVGGLICFLIFLAYGAMNIFHCQACTYSKWHTEWQPTAHIAHIDFLFVTCYTIWVDISSQHLYQIHKSIHAID